MSCSELLQRAHEENHVETTKVEQNYYGSRDQPGLILTEGLGPCIGICIAWDCWAGILHSSRIEDDAKDLIPALIKDAKQIIPSKAIRSVQPVLCGGDVFLHPDESEGDDEEHAKRVLKSRKTVKRLLCEAGFGKPIVKWSNSGERGSLIADLTHGLIFVEHDSENTWCWQISRPTTKTARSSKSRNNG